MTGTLQEIGTAVGVATLCVAACVTDLRSRRLPNLLTFGAAAVGFGWQLVSQGWGGAAASLEGFALGLALFLPWFALGGMGAGDVKLLAAIGAWLGPWRVIWVALFGSIAGGALALVVALWSGYAAVALKNIWWLVTEWWYAGIRPLPRVSLQQSAGPRLAYAVPVAVGVMVTLWLR